MNTPPRPDDVPVSPPARIPEREPPSVANADEADAEEDDRYADVPCTD